MFSGVNLASIGNGLDILRGARYRGPHLMPQRFTLTVSEQFDHLFLLTNGSLLESRLGF